MQNIRQAGVQSMANDLFKINGHMQTYRLLLTVVMAASLAGSRWIRYNNSPQKFHFLPTAKYQFSAALQDTAVMKLPSRRNHQHQWSLKTA